MKKILVLAILIIYFAAVLPGQIKGVTDKVVMYKNESIINYEKSYALLIGVSKYKYWPTLENIPSELQLLESSLGKQGFIISKCLNPDCKQLKEAIENFINENGLKQGNRLLIFFSGHGYTRKDGKKGYIVPADADNPKNNEMGFVQKAIEMEQILTWARRIEARHALFVFDSCFSGTVFQSKTSPAPAYVSYLTGKPVRQFITAGSAGETVPAESHFTKCFARGIAGEGDEDRDGYITGTELGLYLQKKIIEYKLGQTPQVGKIRDPELDQGDFVFITDRSYPIRVLKGRIIPKENEKKKKKISPVLIVGGIVAGIITTFIILKSSKKINGVEIRIINADDRAEIYVNGSKALSIDYGVGPGGMILGKRPGYTDWVKVDQFIKKGQNTFRFVVWNAATPGSACGNFYVRHNGTTVLEKSFFQETDTEGIKYDMTFTVSF